MSVVSDRYHSGAMTNANGLSHEGVLLIDLVDIKIIVIVFLSFT